MCIRDSGDLRRAAADARANRPVRGNEVPGDADIDDASEHHRKNNDGLPLVALQKALYGPDKGLGQAEEGGNGNNHCSAHVLLAINNKQGRRREGRGNKMKRNRREGKVAKSGCRDAWKSGLVAAILGKDGGACRGAENLCADQKTLGHAEGNGVKRDLADIGAEMFEQDKLRPLPNDHFNNHDGDALPGKRQHPVAQSYRLNMGSLPQEDAGQGGEKT